MKLVESELLAADLEKGIGESVPLIKGVDPWMRLRSSVCGMTSTALAEQMKAEGYDVELVESKPRLNVDYGMTHVFVVVHGEGPDTIVDPTYSQFLSYAGLTPMFVFFGGKNSFPDEKIASFEYGNHDEIVTRLTLIARHVIEHYEPVPEYPYATIRLDGLDDDEIAAIYKKIWDPEYFEPFQPNEYIQNKGQQIASYILPEHIKLLA